MMLPRRNTARNRKTNTRDGRRSNQGPGETDALNYSNVGVGCVLLAQLKKGEKQKSYS